MKPQHYKQAVAILDNCGARHVPMGESVVPLYKGFLIPLVLQGPVLGGVNPAVPITFVKEITGEVPWAMRAISFDQATLDLMVAPTVLSANVNLRLQVKLPSGRFLFGGNGVDVGQLFWGGAWRWLQDPAMIFQPGDKITFSLTPYGNWAYGVISLSVVPITLLLEGAYLYSARGQGDGMVPLPVSSMPRYQGDLNENILAPAWMWNEGIRTPQGYRDDYQLFSSPNPSESASITTWALIAGLVVGGQSVQKLEIPIEPGAEFHVRRILCDVQTTGTAAGTVVGRIRSGEGNSLNDSEIDLCQYLNGAEFGGDFVVSGGDTVYVDLGLLDSAGTGNVTLQIHLEGHTRRPL